MEWLLFVLGGGGLAWAGRHLWDRRSARRTDAEELAQIRSIADEDVTLLGEELSRLDAEVSGRDLDVATRDDFQRALDAYESARRAVTGLSDAEAISKVTDTLATGRYAMVCVRARVAGVPVPERRVPCFFNPQHGPSTRDVLWTKPGHGTRQVPACAQDAARVASGEEPEVRSVQYGGLRVPYWEAGLAFAPYGAGYFAAGQGASFGAIAAFDTSSGIGDWSGGAHGDFDGGVFNGGGYDGGGGDSGG